MSRQSPLSPERSFGSALATERVSETHWPHFLIVSTAGILIPAAMLAPVLHWALAIPGLTLWEAFAGLVQLLFVIMPMVVVVIGAQSEAGYLKRAICRIDVFEHGVEIRDGQGALAGETANGTARVARTNIGTNRGMIGGVVVEYRGGNVLLTPRQFVGAYPGLPASLGTWRAVPEATHELLLRFAPSLDARSA